MRLGLQIVAVTAIIFFGSNVWAEREGNQSASKGSAKVFILAGQSNMEGAGAIRGNMDRNGGKGGLEYLVKDPATADRYQHLVDENGDWVVRDDVWIRGTLLSSAPKTSTDRRKFHRRARATTGIAMRKPTTGSAKPWARP